MDLGEILVGGGLWLAVPIAVAAGLISFASPCVLPLVPGYLGYVSGAVGVRPPDPGSPETGPRAPGRGRTVAGAALFVAGFSAVFLAVNLLASTAGRFFLDWLDVLLRVGGVIVILLGLVFIGQVTVLQRRLAPGWRPPTGLIGAPLLGVVFALGWTPCISPTLTAVIVLSGFDPWRALVLGVAYCAGLGVPFLLVALGFGWVGGGVAWVRRRIRAINIAGGALLVVIGVLLVTGVWGWLMTSLGAVIGGFVSPL